jgi:PAP2 superfamily
VAIGWDLVALFYVSYLAAVALARREFARARWPLLMAAAVAWVSWSATVAFRGAGATLAPALHVALPTLVLLVGYWLSGLFFVRPDVRIERRLQAVDDVVLIRSGVLAWFRQAPQSVTEYFELSYLLVYFMIPAGAAMLALGGHQDQIADYWTVVLLAEFASYGMLPWIQTRPPRAIEAVPTSAPPSRLVRRLNLGVSSRASIQANTVPSGHAAGAVAAALTVGSTMPAAGAALMVLAVSIAAASVLGRYHYLVDAVLGVLVAIAAWLVV